MTRAPKRPCPDGAPYFAIWRRWTMEGYTTDYKCCMEGHSTPEYAENCHFRHKHAARGLECVGVATAAYWEEN